MDYAGAYCDGTDMEARVLFRFAKFTFALFILVCILQTVMWTRNLLTQNGFLDANAIVNFPSSTTILPVHDEIVASGSKLFRMAISWPSILFVICVAGAIWLVGLGFTRFVKSLDDRHSPWPERF
jgi:hypothetical protein